MAPAFAISEPTLIVLATVVIVLMWYGAVQGRPSSGDTAHGEFLRRRHTAVSLGLGLCGMGAVSTLWHPLALSVALTVAGICAHAALEPSRQTFWHHRRTRLFAVSLLAGFALLGHAFLISVLVPLLGAAGVFHGHLRQNRKFLTRLLTEMDQLRQGHMRLCAKLHNGQIADSGDDIYRKAG